MTDVSSRTLRKDNSGVPQRCCSANLQVQASCRNSQRELGTVRSFSSKPRTRICGVGEVQGDNLVLDGGCRDARVVVIGGSNSLFGVFRSHTGMARARDVQVEEPRNWSPLMTGHVKFYVCSEGNGFSVRSEHQSGDVCLSAQDLPMACRKNLTSEPNTSHISSQMKREQSNILRSRSWCPFVDCVLVVTTGILYDVVVMCCMNGFRVI